MPRGIQRDALHTQNEPQPGVPNKLLCGISGCEVQGLKIHGGEKLWAIRGPWRSKRRPQPSDGICLRQWERICPVAGSLRPALKVGSCSAARSFTRDPTGKHRV